MSEFILRQDVPLPRKQSVKMLQLPFEEMEIGESFEVECDNGSQETKIRSAASRYGTKLGKRFAVRKLDGDKVGVWRTE